MLTEIETRATSSFNKNLNIPYVYSVTVFLDDRSGKRTYKCHMIGELDEAGSIVPTRSKGRLTDKRETVLIPTVTIRLSIMRQLSSWK